VVQAVLDVHDTPSSSLLVAPVGLGVVWSDQLVPFQRSANVRCVPALLMKYPTAVHAAVDVHDTALSRLLVAPVGLGVGWIAQLAPFQCSANVTRWPALSTKSPMAMQAVLDAHDTPWKVLCVAPAGWGMVWSAQAVPFQRSAKLTAGPPRVVKKYPTAVHAEVEVHDTPASPLLNAPLGLRVVWSDQLVPFERSANVSCVPALSVTPPTAPQAVVDVHEIPPRLLDVAPVGFWVFWTDQLVPSQRSAKVPLEEPPTAVHTVADAHDTP
jgi:hypothetical protein